jgi:4-oxalocrotonate tautomerase
MPRVPGLNEKEIEDMPTIRVELFEGRSPQQKAALAARMTQACVDVLGGSPASVDVIFVDVARHDWATAGVLWSQQDHPGSVP